MSLDVEFSTEPISIALTKSEVSSHTIPSELIADSPHNISLPTLSDHIWVPSAKVGQLVRLDSGVKILTRDAIISSLGTWNNGSIIDAHKTIREGFQIYGDKFEDPFLYFLLDPKTANDVSDSMGGSIDARATEVVDDKVTKMKGVGYSIIPKGDIPMCTQEAGCGVIAAAESRKAPLDTTWAFNKVDYSLDELESACAWSNTAKPKGERTKEDYKLAYKLPDGTIVWAGVHAAMAALNGARTPVNIPTSDKERVYKVLSVAYALFDKQPPELKANVESKGGDEEIMADEEEGKAEVMFTAAQIDDRITAAVGEAIENSDNAHKAELADINVAHTDELSTIVDTHTAELEEQKTKMFELASLIETAKTKYGLDDEKVKILQDAKTPEDILKCFSELEIKKEAEVAASVAKSEEGGTGVVVASTPPNESVVTQIEEVGSYDPYKKEWVPSFREEVE
jgi:hypothetical protein